MNPSARILIVDDEEKIRKVLSSILGMRGYEALEASSGEEALDLLGRKPIDAVLLDILMPGIGGMEVLAHIRRELPEVPVIMITAYGNISLAVEAIKKGAYDFIEKPLDAEKILISLRNAIDRYRLSGEVSRLRQALLERYRMVGKSQAMRQVYRQIERLAPLDTTVLITGETGTGKELVARCLHNLSPRISQPFVKINCAALPHELIESELFGHAKGAFTSASQEKPGKFEAAEGGTIFLDEIAELSPAAQAKLLQVLEEKKFTRLGEVKERSVNVRILAATNRLLEEEIDKGKFRGDLYYRLRSVTIHLLPLRERTEDIAELVQYYVPLLCDELDLPRKSIVPEALSLFLDYSWPGNVRELKHRLQEMVIYHRGDQMDAKFVRDWLPGSGEKTYPEGESGAGGNLRNARQQFEREYILRALIAHDWNIPATAKYLGIERTNLYRKMKGLGIGR